MGKVTRKIKTPCCGEFYWVKGLTNEEGVLNELSGEYERSLTIRYHKDSEQLKQIMEEIRELWKEYKNENPKVKAKEPSAIPVKPVLDENGEETDYVEIKFKTKPKFPDGKINWVRIYNAKGIDVTEQLVANGTLIGNGSKGIVFGTFATYEYAKKHGITAYLTAIQLAKLIEYKNEVETEDLTALDEEADFVAVPDAAEPVAEDDENLPF